MIKVITRVLACVVCVAVFSNLAGCMLAEKGVRATASLGIEGYSDHTETISVKPDDEPIVCKVYQFAFCKGAQASPANQANQAAQQGRAS